MEISRKNFERIDRQSLNVNLRNNQAGSFREERIRPSENQDFAGGASDSRKNNNFVVGIFDKIIGFSIFALFFGIPVYFTGLASQGIIFEKQLYFYFLLLLGVVAWAAKGVVSGEMNIRRTPLDLPILGFWLAYAAATIFSVDRWHSFWGAYSDPSRGFMSVSAYIIAYYFIFSNFNSKRLRLIFSAIIGSGAVMALWTTLAIFNIKFLPDKIIPYAPLSLPGSVTGLAIIFSALVPIIITAILKIADVDTAKTRKVFKSGLISFLLAFLALDLFLILALYDYVPWLGFFVGIVFFLIFILSKIVRPNAGWTWLPMVVFVLIMMLRLTGAVSISKINLPVEVSLNYKTSASIAWESLKEKFLVGSGPATYGYDFSLNRPKEFNQNAFYNLRFAQGTGIMAEAIPTIGVIGTFFLVVIVLSYIGSQFYLVYKDRERNKLYSLGFLSSTIVLLISILSIRIDGVILSMSVLLFTSALATALGESEAKEEKLSLSLKASPKFALALAFVFMVVSAGVAFFFVYLGKVYAADIYARRAVAGIGTSRDTNEILMDFNRATSLNKQESRYYVQIGQYFMALANQEASKEEDSRSIEKIQQYLTNSVNYSNRAKEISKNDVHVVESLALIYENAGLYVPDSLKLAEDNYKRAQELEPHNPIYYVKLGQIKIGAAGAKENVEEKKKIASEVKELFQKAIEKKENYDNGYYHLALTNEALGEMDQAIENAQKAAKINPKNANYLLVLARLHQSRNSEGDMKLAEKYYKAIVKLNDSDINGHFYLGLFYEKEKNKDGAKNEYKKVIDIIEKNRDTQKNAETISQLKKMIDNVDRGIENTPESLGLIAKNEEAEKPQNVQPEIQPANVEGPTLEETETAEE